MAFDASDLLLKYLVPEPRLKLSLPQRCRRNTHSFLSTTNQNLRKSGIIRDANKHSYVTAPTKGRLGARAALFKGVSVLKVLMTIRFLVSCTCGVSSQNRYFDTLDTRRKEKTHPSSLVFTASYALHPVLAHLKICHHIAMRPLIVVNLLAGLDIKKRDLA